MKIAWRKPVVVWRYYANILAWRKWAARLLARRFSKTSVHFANMKMVKLLPWHSQKPIGRIA
jgi:hypothetical protein